MTLQIYGYAGCTTVKKAREWAENEGVATQYEHFNKVSDLRAHIEEWVLKAGIDAVFNARAQTLKKMEPEAQAAILENTQSRIKAMVADPRLIKRPVGYDGQTVLTGFDRAAWQSAFA